MTRDGYVVRARPASPERDVRTTRTDVLQLVPRPDVARHEELR